WSGDNVTAVGSTDPELYGNFNTFFRYKQLQLNLAFGYRFGGQQYNQTLINKVETTSYRYNVDARVYESRWMAPGDIAAFKGILVTTPTYKTSRFVQDENTLTLNNIHLNYTFSNQRVLQTMRMRSLDL